MADSPLIAVPPFAVAGLELKPIGHKEHRERREKPVPIFVLFVFFAAKSPRF